MVSFGIELLLQATLMACNAADPFKVLLLLALHKVSQLSYTKIVQGCTFCPRPHSSWNIRLYQIVACLIHTSVLHTRFVCMYTHTYVFKLSHFTSDIHVVFQSTVFQPNARYAILRPGHYAHTTFTTRMDRPRIHGSSHGDQHPETSYTTQPTTTQVLEPNSLTR